MLPNVPHFSLYTWCSFVDKYLWTLPQTWNNIARRQLTESNHIWEFVVVVNTQGESYKTTNNLLLGVFLLFLFFIFTSFCSPSKPMLQTTGAVCFTNVRVQRIYRPAWVHAANSIKAIFPHGHSSSHFCHFKQTFVQILLLNPCLPLWLPSQESMGSEVKLTGLESCFTC